MYQSTFGANLENEFDYNKEGAGWEAVKAGFRAGKSWYTKPFTAVRGGAKHFGGVVANNKIETGVVAGLGAAGLGGAYLLGRRNGRKQSMAYPGGYESEYDDNYENSYESYDYNDESDVEENDYGYDDEGALFVKPFMNRWSDATNTGFFKPFRAAGAGFKNVGRTIMDNKIETGVLGGLGVVGGTGAYLLGRRNGRRQAGYYQ